MAILSGENLAVAYGHREIFSGLDCEIAEGARIGIVGPNGSGKTSLLRLIAGAQEPDSGAIHHSKGLRIGYVPQAPPLTTTGTLYEEILSAFAGLQTLEQQIEEAAAEMANGSAEAGRRHADLLHAFESRGGYDYHSAVERTAAGLGLTRDALNTPAALASGGERTRAAMAKALLADPDLLVLDEPTNHLDLAGLAWLERFLGKFNHAFIVVSHDRYFLDKVVTEIWDLSHGRLRSYPGNYTKYRILREEAEAFQQKQYEQQQEFIAKEEEFIRRYRAGQKAAQAMGRLTRLNRLERLEGAAAERRIALPSASASRTGQAVVRAKNLKVGFAADGEPVTLFAVPDLIVERGARIAILGGNGAGKTTLIKTLFGEQPPLAGDVTLGVNVKPGYFHQKLEDLPESLSVLDAFLEAKQMPHEEARRYLGRFLFQRDETEKRVGDLSGGQRSRLALARLLITKPNVLVLDEPTNHLDIPSRDALEDVLTDYDGTLLLVSHDRRFISLLAQQLWLVEKGSMRLYQGTFDEWLEEQEKAAQAPPPKPKAKEAPKPPVARKKDKGPKPPETEEVIAELERKLKELDAQLDSATERRDLAAIARLGAEHTATQELLEKTWAEWAG